MANPKRGHLLGVGEEYVDPAERALSVDSTESRWVFQEDDDDAPSEIEDFDASDLRHQSMFDSDDEDNADQRLVRTGPRIDSFDVEALEVPGAHRNDYEDVSVGKRIVLAFQTLGIVFGDVGTSPLYTFSVMFRKAPINENEDILGALSLVLYTLILIPLVKYVIVVLWANDDGEGYKEKLVEIETAEGLGPYSTSIKKVEKEIKDMAKKVNGLCGIKETDTDLAAPRQWDLVSDKQIMQEEQPLQVARCTKIINPNSEDAKYVINVKQIAKFVVGLGDKVSPTNIEEGMHVGYVSNK